MSTACFGHNCPCLVTCSNFFSEDGPVFGKFCTDVIQGQIIAGGVSFRLTDLMATLNAQYAESSTAETQLQR